MTLGLLGRFSRSQRPFAIKDAHCGTNVAMATANSRIQRCPSPWARCVNVTASVSVSLALGLLAWGVPSSGLAQVPVAERRAVLEATRPPAAQRVGQPVRFMVERLNVDGDWALLMGELVSASGGPLNWDKAKECHRELDKLLWVLLTRQAGRWRVLHLEVCATEHPHWSLEQFGGLVWPCGLYAGLQSATGEDLQAACLKQRAAPSLPPARR